MLPDTSASRAPGNSPAKRECTATGNTSDSSPNTDGRG